MAGFGADAAATTVEAQGAAMRVVQQGTGPDIVWVPGGDAPAEYWVEQFDFFTADHRCTSYDPRGVGETTAAAPSWTIADFAADCAEVIRQRCDPPVILTGLSMGGLITQAVACAYPDLVRLAIPMGTAAFIDGFTRDWMQAEIDFRRAGHALPADFAACHYAAFAYPARALGDAEVWARVKAAYTVRFGDRDPAMLIAQWQACLDYDGRAALADCAVPIHVIGFTEDVQTPPGMCRQVAELAPKGRFHEIEGLGHVSFTRHRPAVVAAAIRRIVAGAM